MVEKFGKFATPLTAKLKRLRLELLKVLLEKEKTAPVVANRRFIDCKRLWRYAINHGHTEINTPDRISTDAFKKHEVKHRPKITDEKVLGEMLRAMDHQEGNQVVRAYAHLPDYTEQMRELLQWWADFLDELKVKKYD